MAISFGTASTGGGAQNFRVGYEITSFVDYSTGGAITSATATASAEMTFYVRNAQAVSNDTQTFDYAFFDAFVTGNTTNTIINTNSVATNEQIGNTRIVTYDYSTWGTAPPNFSGSITGRGSSAGAAGFYTGGAATHSWSIAIPARPGGVPSAPTSVTSTPNNGSVTISFGVPSTNNPATTSYQSSTDNINFSNIALFAPFNVAGTNGTALTVYVRAVNAAGPGPTASATSTPRTVPSAPASVTSTPSNGSVSIAFTAPSSNGGNAITAYQYSTDSVNYIAVPSNTSPFTVNGTNGTAITVYVRAVNDAGAGSPTSATSTPRTVPSAPTNVASTPANGSISVSFDAPSSNGGSAVTGYEYSTNAGSTYTAVPSNTSPFTVSGTNGIAITVLVRATNAAGASATASTSNTPRTVPSAPQSFAGDNTTFGQITLSWSAPSSNGGNAVSSYVLRNDSTVLQNTIATSYVHTGLSPYTDYSYTVTAANAAGESTAASLTIKTMGGVVNIATATPSTYAKILPKICTNATVGSQVFTEAQARVWTGTEWKHGI